MTEYTLQPATESDKARFRQLHELCYRDVVEKQFGEYDTKIQREFFEEKWWPSRFTKIVVEKEIVGCLGFVKSSDHIFVSEIQLAPEFQNRGIGSRILHNIQREAVDSEIPIRLQVLLLNRAIDLYRRLGFIVVGESDTHFDMEWTPPLS